jgi:hypothetical protein
MKRVLTAALAALALSACATATPYQPAGPNNRNGFSEYQVESNRFRVSFHGNSVTSRETVEAYLLFRAAELTLQNGYDWFETVDRNTERDTRYVATPDPLYSSPFYGPRLAPYWGGYGPYWRPYWRTYGYGRWSAWDPFWPRDVDVRAITRYEANAEIVMRRGPRPAGNPEAFDAREVVQNLQGRVIRPAA